MPAAERTHLPALKVTAFAAVCALAIAASIAYVLPDLAVPSGIFVDFRLTIWEPGQDLLNGRDPLRQLGAEENGGIYPPATILLTLPVSALPYQVAAAIWLFALVGAAASALYLCGVRDWRCYAAAFASPPVVAALAYGNITLLVLLALAGIWVTRDKPWKSGLLLGLVIATRLFPWPVVVWFLLTRRVRAAIVTVASSVVFSLLGWLAVRFHRIDEFPAVTRSNASEFVDQGVSVASMTANLGASSQTIVVVLALVGAATLATAARNRDDDLACFSWAIAAALFASPIVWGHYFALMLVPIAVASPRLSRMWLLPFLTAPQLTSSFEPGQKILDAASGVLFACLTAWKVRGTAHPGTTREPLAFGRSHESARTEQLVRT